MRYYVLTTRAGDEVVRVSRGNASYYEAKSGRWIPDPLLAVEVQIDGDWREVAPDALPSGIGDVSEETTRTQRSRGPRRGRHIRR